MIQALLAGLILSAGPASASTGDAIAASAERYLRQKPGLVDRSCTGLTTAILLGAGVELRGTVRDFYEATQSAGWNHYHKLPHPGDLAYFDHTWDVDRDGRANDRLSHIAVVVAVGADGTVELVHYGSGEIQPLYLNLRRPDLYTDADGRVLNSYLAAPGYGPENRRLAGQLWAGFATVKGSGDPVLASRRRSRTAESVGLSEGAGGGMPWVVASEPGRRGRTQQVRQLEDGAVWPYEGRSQRPPRGSAEGRAVRGRAVPEGMLWGSSCEELWYLRNAVYARHGYSFVTAEARGVFEAEPWYQQAAAVSEDTVGALLSRRDQRNVQRLVAAEQAAGCGP